MTPIICDLETYWGPDYTLSNMTTESYIRDPQFKVHGAGIKIGSGASVWIPGKHLPAVLAKIDWTKAALVGHNLHFDGSILAWHYGITPKRYIDTLALSRALVGCHSAKHGLEPTAELLCGLKKYPGFLKETYGVRDLPASMEKTLATYCAGPVSPCGQYAGDVLLTWEVLRKLLPLISADELDALHWSIKIFTQPAILLDHAMLVQYNEEVKQAKVDALKSAGLTSRDLLMSNPKYAEALIQLGVEPPTKISVKTGKTSFAFAKTDEGHKALLEHEDVRVQALVAARMEVKSTIEETRSLAYLGAATRGAWPVDLRYAGAHTIRFSGGNGGGGNPQNLKRGGTLRDAICAPEGKIFLVSDLSQIEARIALWIGVQMPKANAEFESLEVMRLGGDIYSFFGTHIYGMEINKKTHPFERQVAKSAVLGLGFGMGWKRFIEYCKTQGIKNMSPDEAKRIVGVYRSMYGGVKETWDWFAKVALPNMVNGVAVSFPEENPLFSIGPDLLFGKPSIAIPGRLQLKYPGMERSEDGQWQYWKAGAKKATKVFGGFMLENVVQAVAGRMLREHIVNITHLAPSITIVTNTHDELLTLIDDRPELQAYRAAIARGEKVAPPITLESELIERVMTTVPSYMPGLPIAVEYDYGYRYGDCK